MIKIAVSLAKLKEQDYARMNKPAFLGLCHYKTFGYFGPVLCGECIRKEVIGTKDS